MLKRFFIQLTIVIVVAGIFSSLYYLSICHGLRHAKEGVPAKLDYIFYDTTKYDVLFVGSSRVLRNINPILFDSISGLHSYNAGIDGANCTLIDLMIRKFLKSHTPPRYLFINLDIYTFEKDTSFFFYPQFLTYMDDPDLQRMKQREPNLTTGSRYPFIGVSYFNDYLKEVAFYTHFNLCPPADSLYLRRGFMPARDTAYHGTDESHPLNYAFVPDRVRRLDELCSFCKQNGCRIFFIMAPIYRSTDSDTGVAKELHAQLRSVESKYDIREFNHYTDRTFPKNEFMNLSHLNYKGADRYTRLIADSFMVLNGQIRGHDLH